MKNYKFFSIEKIKLDKDNRMLRLGFGKNQATWFFRIDLWAVGYRIKKRKIENYKNINVFPQEQNYLPITLITKSDIESVLNYYLLNNWDASYEYIDGLYNVTITFTQPLLKKRINLAKEYVNNHKMIGMIVNYN